MDEKIVLQANKICKSFHDPVDVQILKDITFSIKKGEFVSITGKSGCGKSTLLWRCLSNANFSAQNRRPCLEFCADPV